MVLLSCLLLTLVMIYAENIIHSIDLTENGVTPEPRANPTLAVNPVGKLIYLFGGQSKCCFLNDLWTFDLEKNIWNIIYAQSDLPGKEYLEPRKNSGSFYRGKTQEFCIYSGSSDLYIFFDLWCFSTSLYAWSIINYPSTILGPISQARYLEYKDQEYFIYLSVDNPLSTTAYV